MSIPQATMSIGNEQLYDFGQFRLDIRERLFLKDGLPVPLTPKAFEILVVLVQRSGHLVKKEELLKEVWSDSFVEESNLTRNIYLLRKALGKGENGYPHIETVPRKGYRLIADVRTVPVQAEQATPLEALSRRAHRTTGNDSRRRALLGLIILLIGAAGAFLAIKKYVWPKGYSPAPHSFDRMRINSLTSLGKIWEAAVSPDGRYLAYVAIEDGKQSLWVKQIESDSSIRIVPPGLGHCLGLTFSPDGNHIFYSAYVHGSPSGIFQVPVLGGIPRRLVVGVDSPVTISPDGKWIAFVRLHRSPSENRLMIANVDGTGERLLSTRKYPDFYDGNLAWSPDGKTIATGAGSQRDDYVTGVVEVSIADGRETRLTPRTWAFVRGVAWLADKSGLIVVASASETEYFHQLWHVSYPGGEIRRITKDLINYQAASLPADSSHIVTVQAEQRFSVLVSPDRDPAHAKELILTVGGKFSNMTGLSWTPDGKIVYSSAAKGNRDIWIMDADGNNQKRLTDDPASDMLPAVSPDGRYITFISTRTGAQQIWRMDIDGQNQKRLTDGGMKYRQRWSPDSKWIVYSSFSSEAKSTLWKVSVDGGEPIQLNKKYSRFSAVSPDGKLIACYYWDERAGLFKLAVIPFEGGEPVKVFEPPVNHFHWSLQWTADGRALLYVQTLNGLSSIWRMPLNDSPPEMLREFQSGNIQDAAWSNEGKQFACILSFEYKDVVSITDFR
jgi:Tol biopolymer transport system component/DNA-binding winged helix-turn-helix (wHTH) protein